MSTVLVLIDAFRHDYLDKSNTKFLWERSKKGHHIEKIQQSLGYCERTEILTGLKGKESGFTAAIGFDPNRSCYRSLRFKGTLNAIDKVFFKLCKLLPLTFMSRLYFSIRRRYIGLAISASCKMKSYGIPIKWLPHFSLTEDYYDHRDDNAFPSLSLFDLLKSNNKTFSVLSFTALGTESDLHSDEDRLKAVISEARTNPKDLYLVYL